MNEISSILVVVMTLLVGVFAYIFCFTLNEDAIGGYLPFAIVTLAPAISYGLGRFIPSSR